MNEYIPIKSLQVGQTYSQVFLISGVANKVSKKASGKPYILITLKDVTGTIRGCLWDAQIDPDNEKMWVAGNFVGLTVVVESYNNEKTCIVNHISGLAETPKDNLTDYIHGPNNHVLNVLKEDIEKSLSEIEDPNYRDIIYNARERLDILNMMAVYPYELEGHLAYRGGLLNHTALVLRTALCMVNSGREPSVDIRIDKSLVVLGVIFRNLGYINTVKSDGTSFVEDDAYKLLGIRYASAIMANHIIISTESDMKVVIPEAKKLALQNCCLAETLDQCATIEARIVLLANQFANEIYSNTNLYNKHKYE